MVKDLGTEFDQAMPHILRGLMDERADRTSQSKVARALGEAILSVPAYSIQGGTRLSQMRGRLPTYPPFKLSDIPGILGCWV
jgi:hypothetical protein